MLLTDGTGDFMGAALPTAGTDADADAGAGVDVDVAPLDGTCSVDEDDVCGCALGSTAAVDVVVDGDVDDVDVAVNTTADVAVGEKLAVAVAIGASRGGRSPGAVADVALFAEVLAAMEGEVDMAGLISSEVD